MVRIKKALAFLHFPHRLLMTLHTVLHQLDHLLEKSDKFRMVHQLVQLFMHSRTFNRSPPGVCRPMVHHKNDCYLPWKGGQKIDSIFALRFDAKQTAVGLVSCDDVESRRRVERDRPLFPPVDLALVLVVFQSQLLQACVATKHEVAQLPRLQE